jgi:hypothetical protein
MSAHKKPTLELLAHMKAAKLKATHNIGRHMEPAGYAYGKPTPKPPGKPPLPNAHAFEARKDGSLIIYATMPRNGKAIGDLVCIRIKPNGVMTALCACGDALANKPSLR